MDQGRNDSLIEGNEDAQHKCSKCDVEINMKKGYYSTHKGVMCSSCWESENSVDNVFLTDNESSEVSDN